ncbi:hypothetical protein HDK90DRAFT_488565, partial [Phyllosticta capitalensis]
MCPERASFFAFPPLCVQQGFLNEARSRRFLVVNGLHQSVDMLRNRRSRFKCPPRDHAGTPSAPPHRPQPSSTPCGALGRQAVQIALQPWHPNLLTAPTAAILNSTPATGGLGPNTRLMAARPNYPHQQSPSSTQRPRASRPPSSSRPQQAVSVQIPASRPHPKLVAASNAAILNSTPVTSGVGPNTRLMAAASPSSSPIAPRR